jgi:hypothetical protein
MTSVPTKSEKTYNAHSSCEIRTFTSCFELDLVISFRMAHDPYSYVATYILGSVRIVRDVSPPNNTQELVGGRHSERRQSSGILTNWILIPL